MDSGARPGRDRGLRCLARGATVAGARALIVTLTLSTVAACGGGQVGASEPELAQDPVPTLTPLALGSLAFFAAERRGPTLDVEGTLRGPDGSVLGHLAPEGVLDDPTDVELGRLSPEGQVLVDGRRTPQRIQDDGTLARDGSDRVLQFDDQGHLAGMTVPSEVRVDGARGPLARTAMFLYAVMFFPGAHGMLAQRAFGP